MPGPVRMHGQQFLTDEEKANAPKVTKELLLRILGYLKPYWVQFLLVFLAILVSAVVGLLPSIITGRIVDTALVGNDLGLLIRLLLTALAAMLVSWYAFLVSMRELAKRPVNITLAAVSAGVTGLLAIVWLAVLLAGVKAM